MRVVLSRNDGSYDTTVLALSHPGLRLPFQWIVVDRRDKRSLSGRATTAEYAKHDARRALAALRREAGEKAEAA